MKRRWLAIVCAAAMLLLAATSCEKSGEVTHADTQDGETSPVMRLMTRSFYNYKYGDDYRPYLMMYGDTVVCDSETAEAYPSLAKALAEDSSRLFKAYQDVADSYTPEMWDVEPEIFSTPHRYTFETKVRRADRNAVTLGSFTYAYSGGAHGMPVYDAQNYDTATGEPIRLSDVVKDEGKLREALLGALRKDYPDAQWYDGELSLEPYRVDWQEGDEEGNPYFFSLDPDGVCFYFNPYELGPYANGLQMVKLLYSEEPELFSKDYAVGGSYAVGLHDEDKFDIGSDGTVDALSLERSGEGDDTEDHYTRITVKKNGAATAADLYGFRTDAFLMHTADGRDYLYVFSHQENDYTELAIFDMNGEKPALLKKAGYGLPVTYEDNYGGYYQITDSGNFELTFRCDLLATFSASFTTSVGADGLPVLPEDGFYEVPETIEPLRSKTEFRADIVDESGKITEKDVVLKAGESFKLLRTDGNTVIDATLSDGRIARIRLVRGEDSYIGTVNGQLSEEDAFETLYYAG